MVKIILNKDDVSKHKIKIKIKKVFPRPCLNFIHNVFLKKLRSRVLINLFKVISAPVRNKMYIIKLDKMQKTEYAINGETAILTDPNKLDELFKGVCYLLDNNYELLRISNEGYKKVKSFFDWNKSVEEFERYIPD